MKFSRLAGMMSSLCWLSLLASPAIGADASPPVTTADEAARRLGQSAVVEFTVVNVKHPERRQAVFLTSSRNFRSPESLSVMIRDADLTRFDAKDDEELAGRYLNRRIRVQGEIARDEGQIIVRVSSRDQISIVEAVTTATKQGKIVVTNENGQQRQFTPEELAKFPQEECQTEHDGEHQNFSGVSLAVLLKKAGIVLGEESRGRYLSRYVLVSANDGYQALFSIGEIDPYLRPQAIILANACNGQPLTETDGPWRLIVKDDVRHRRWVRSVTGIVIRNADVAEAQSTKKSDESK